MSLERLLRPQTIAVIGGGAWCTAVVQQCKKSGFSGEVLAVHPSRSEVGGVATVPSVDDLPWAPDASFIGVNRKATITVLKQLAVRKAGGAVCFASGFRESEDAEGDGMQSQLIDAAGGMAVLGPNCYGFLNNLDGAVLWPDQHGLIREEQGVAILTQSSNIAINLTMQTRGLPVAYIVTTGNQAQQDLATVAISLLHDTRVTAIGLHIEGISDVPRFEAFAKLAYERGVSVVALKVGASDAAQMATLSHTASLAGSHAGAASLLQRFGIAQVHSLPQMLEALKLAHVFKRVPGGRIASLSCSGGEASLLADAVQRHPDLSLPVVSDATQTTLNAHLGPHVSKVNPLDYHTDIWRNREAMAAVFGAMTGEPFDLTIIVLDFPRTDRCDLTDWFIAVDAICDAAREPDARMVVLASLVENLPETQCEILLAHGIAPLMDIDAALAAIASMIRVEACAPQAVWPPAPPLIDQPRVVVHEAVAKTWLAASGVRIPQQCVVASPEEARTSKSQFDGAVVLKGVGVAHKSEGGYVALNLSDPRAVFNAADQMSPKPDEWLMETMIDHVVLELLVGVVHDPAHGYLMTLAAGGVLTELMQDKVSLLMPVTAEDIDTALESLAAAPLIRGYRGRQGANKAEIIKQVLALQAFMQRHRHAVHEVEINPLLCTHESAIAGDALLITQGVMLL